MTPEMWIAAKIKESGLKIYFVAEKAGIDAKVLSAIINSHRRIRADELLKVCAVLNVNPMDYVKLAEGKANA